MSTLTDTDARLRSLDFLRGLAVLMVVGFHCAIYAPSGEALADALFGFGKLGVQLFFLVSALTMCRMWEQRQDENHRTFKFYIRRFMRIAPMFWLAIAFYVAIEGVGPSVWAPFGMTSTDIALTALFLHNFSLHAINNVVPGGWSIAVEMMFYAIFPLLISRVGSNRRIYLLLAGILIFSYHLLIRDWLSQALLAGPFASHPGEEEAFAYFSFLNQSPIFLIGCFIHFALRDGIAKIEMQIICELAIAATLLSQPFPIICFGLSAFTFFIMRIGASFPAVERFGVNSYAIYLVHFIVIQGIALEFPVESGLGNLLIRVALTASISLILARILHHTIERPVAKLTRRITSALDRRKKTSSAMKQLHEANA